MFEAIIGAIQWLFDKIKIFVNYIVDKVLSFTGTIVRWFKNLNLKSGRHTSFMMSGEKFKEQLHNAPTINAGIFNKNTQNEIFLGVFDETTNSIVESEYIKANEVDQDTRLALQRANSDGLVVLN